MFMERFRAIPTRLKHQAFHSDDMVISCYVIRKVFMRLNQIEARIFAVFS